METLCWGMYNKNNIFSIWLFFFCRFMTLLVFQYVLKLILFSWMKHRQIRIRRLIFSVAS